MSFTKPFSASVGCFVQSRLMINNLLTNRTNNVVIIVMIHSMNIMAKYFSI